MGPAEVGPHYSFSMGLRTCCLTRVRTPSTMAMGTPGASLNLLSSCQVPTNIILILQEETEVQRGCGLPKPVSSISGFEWKSSDSTVS